MAGGRFCGWGKLTAIPTTAWIANQLTEACGSIGIRDRPTSRAHRGKTPMPIGSIRRECIDHIVVFGERYMRHVLLLYMSYYNSTRTHSLNKDAPKSRAVEPAGRLLCHPILGGLIINMFGFDMR